MKKFMILIMIAALCMLLGCKAKISGDVVKETETQETIKSLANEEDLVKQSTNNVQKQGSTCDELDKIQENIYLESYRVGDLKGDMQKKVYELQYYKDKDELKYNQMLKEIDDFKDKIKDQTSKVDGMIAGYKLLAEKCGVKIKLKKF